MAINSASNSEITIGGTPYLSALSGGQITTPAQPAFNQKSVDLTAAGSDVVPSGEVIFKITDFYNTANGRFTAPKAGSYFVRFNQLALNANTGEYRTAIYKNGVPYGGAKFITHKPKAEWLTLIADAVVYMAANDYVTVRYESGSGTLYGDSNYASFSGHFIG